MITDAEHIGQFWASLAVEELVRNGVTRFCIAPGSRSSPLAVAVARNPNAVATVHFDERGAAFFALGWARGANTPAAVITTSGTAAANCLPAVVEASTDGVPLLVVTADRPPELRMTGANQTIQQVNIFGSYVRWAFDLPVATEEIDPVFVLTTVDQAVHRATEQAGPVHLNWMFREPLAPIQSRLELPGNVSLGRWLDRNSPFTDYEVPETYPSERQIANLSLALASCREGVIIAGRLRTREDSMAVVRLAEHLGWPILADTLSSIPADSSDLVVHHLDLLLKSEHFRAAFRPDFVIHLGARATSKVLYSHLSEHPPRQLVLAAPQRVRIDPQHRVTKRFELEVRTFCRALTEATPERTRTSRDGLAAKARNLATRAGGLADATILGHDEITEPFVARAVSRLLPVEHDLFLGASMPVRDVDMFGTPRGSSRYVANRGASGIDGTVASAAGYAAARQTRVTLLLGDLALLHDLNSLDLVRNGEYPITVVVVNNDGGGIFSFLPIASYDAFEKYFGTPHGLTFEKAADMFGIPYHRPENQRDFERDYRLAIESGNSALIEVQSDRARNRSVHEEIYRAVNELAAGVYSAYSRS